MGACALDVNVNELGRQWQDVGGDVLTAVARVGAAGRYILGDEVRRFEAALAGLWGLPHALGVGSGLGALEIALRCLAVGDGDRVLTTPLTAFATTLAIVRVGATPVFIDVDDSGLIDLERCRQACGHDPAIRALVPVHLFGHALPAAELRRLRDDFDLLVVEDCAQSIGATSNGEPTGAIGQIAGTSFYPTKNLGAMGDAGALLTRSPELAERARALRDYGQTSKYEHDFLGLNCRLDELHAAILGSATLARLPGWTARRGEIAATYRAELQHARVSLPPVPAGSRSVWHLFPVLAPAGQRTSLSRHLARRGVASGVHYPKLAPDQKALTDLGRFEVIGELTNARRFAADEVSLPVHPFLRDDEVARVVDAVNSWEPS